MSLVVGSLVKASGQCTRPRMMLRLPYRLVARRRLSLSSSPLLSSMLVLRPADCTPRARPRARTTVGLGASVLAVHLPLVALLAPLLFVVFLFLLPFPTRSPRHFTWN